MKVFHVSEFVCVYCGQTLTRQVEVKDHEIQNVFLSCSTPICKCYGIRCYAPEVELKET